MKALNIKHLRSATKDDVQIVLGVAKDLRQIHRFHRGGYTNDKAKTMRHIAKIPYHLLFHPEYKKYFDPMMDKHERGKNIDRFLKVMENKGYNFRTDDTNSKR